MVAQEGQTPAQESEWPEYPVFSVHNMMFKTPAQRDFSDKQMKDIEFVFLLLSNIREDISGIRFQIGFGT